jgi:hypothetical protein
VKHWHSLRHRTHGCVDTNKHVSVSDTASMWNVSATCKLNGIRNSFNYNFYLNIDMNYTDRHVRDQVLIIRGIPSVHKRNSKTNIRKRLRKSIFKDYCWLTHLIFVRKYCQKVMFTKLLQLISIDSEPIVKQQQLY